MIENVIIFGSSGHAKVIADIVEKLNIHIIGFIDSFETPGTIINGYEVLGNEDILNSIESRYNTNNIIIAIGNNHNRKLVFEKINKINKNINFPKIISCTALVSKSAIIEKGTVVMDNSIVNSNCKIGPFCILNTAAIIEHDCVLDSFVSISPRALICGDVKVKKLSFIGAGAIVIQKKKIAKNVVVAAGAVVTQNLPSNSLLAGIPAKVKISNYLKTNYL